MSARRLGIVLAAIGALAGCELREVSITEPDRAVVAEAYVRIGLRQLLGLPPGTDPEPFSIVSVFLHQTLDASGRSGAVRGARVRVTRPADGLVAEVREISGGTGSCLMTAPDSVSGTCYQTALDEPTLQRLAAGDRLALRIELADGGVLTSETVIPGRFELRDVRDASNCAVLPFTGTGVVWSRSAGAWAYVSDTYISGLARTFGRDEVNDPLYLWGLSVSAQDTSIVFPREFGIFSRGELDHDVSTALQSGLPDSTSALVTIAAVDRNWVNWARGGNFNPSGQVRVPSVRGDGTGVFASAVARSFRVFSRSQPGTLPACPPDVPPVPTK